MIYPNQPGIAPGNDQDAALLLITSPKAAKRMSICERTLWTLTNQGDLPCVRIGRSVRYDPRDIEVWTERHKSAGRASAHNASSAGNLPLNDDHESKQDE